MAIQKKKRSKPRKKKGSVIVSQKAEIVKKGTQTAKKDTLKKAPAKLYRDTGANFKIKIRRK